MTLVTIHKGYEIWANYDHSAEVYELFFDEEGETYTGWTVDSLKEAKAAAKYIVEDVTS